MPDPRIRRPRTPGARHGGPVRASAPQPAGASADAAAEGAEPQELAAPVAAPTDVEAAEPEVLVASPDAAIAPERLEPDAAASAEAEAAALAADEPPVELPADPGSHGAAVDDAPGESDDQAVDLTEEAAARDAAPEEAEEEPVGWFRDEPIDEGEHVAAAAIVASDAEVVEGDATAPDAAPDEVVAPAPDEAAADDVPEPDLDQDREGMGDEADEEADGAPVARDRDRPVATALPVTPPPPRRGRLRGVVLGVVTIVAVAVVGFVAGLMLPTILPGPGVDANPSPTGLPSAAPSLAPVETAAASGTPAATPTATSVAPTAAPTPAPTQVIYVVKPNDQLARIATRFGVTLAAIQKANNIKDPNRITVGQKLVIPVPAVTPAP